MSFIREYGYLEKWFLNFLSFIIIIIFCTHKLKLNKVSIVNNTKQKEQTSKFLLLKRSINFKIFVTKKFKYQYVII